MADEMTVKAIGKLLSDRKFSEDFSRNPERTLEDNRLAVPDDVLPKLIELNTKLNDTVFKRRLSEGSTGGSEGGNATIHINIALSPGIA